MYIPKYYYESKIDSRINHTIHIVKKRFLESKDPWKEIQERKKRIKERLMEEKNNNMPDVCIVIA
jgi:uncharacterized protein with ATP-grasp and redox domains